MRVSLGSIVTASLIFVAAVGAGEPPSESFFSQALKQMGSIPTNFDELLKGLLEKAVRQKLLNGNLPGVLIPDGRSLVKKTADFSSPRQLVVLGPVDQPPTFIGYAPNSKKLEVISWNASKGQYDFLEVSDYDQGRTPKIELANRALCMTCHQNEGPIFSRAPWSETIFFNGIGKKMRDANAKFSDLIMQNVGEFDSQVRNANRDLQANRACRSLCKKEDVVCKKSLIALAILGRRRGFGQDPTILDKLGTELQANKNIQWPSDSFAYPSSVLPNRDPLLNPEKGGTNRMFYITNLESALKALGTDQDSTTRLFEKELSSPGGINLSEILSGFPASLEMVEGVKEVQSFGTQTNDFANPSVPRPKLSPLDLKNRGFAFSLSSCFQLTRKLDMALADLSNQAIYDGVMGTDRLHSLLQAWPPNEGQILRVLRPDSNIEHCSEPMEKPTSPMVDQSIQWADELMKPTESPAPVKELGLFTRYCSECHGAGQSMDLKWNFSELKSLQLFNDGGETLRSRLEKRSMPPASAPQPTEKERNEMIELLKGH